MKYLEELTSSMKKVVMRLRKQLFQLHRKKKQKTGVLKEQKFKASATAIDNRVMQYPLSNYRYCYYGAKRAQALIVKC